MRALAWSLLVIGTVVASLGGARLPSASAVVSGAGLALLIVAIALLRRSQAADRQDGATLSSSDPRSLLPALPERLEVIERDAQALPLPELIRRLDALGAELVTPIADGSPPLLPKLGTQRFASIFGPFASAERALARAWSAAADGHRPEALASLGLALSRSRDAVSALDR